MEREIQRDEVEVLLGSVGHRVKIHQITSTTGKERVKLRYKTTQSMTHTRLGMSILLPTCIPPNHEPVKPLI
jgi:hypothetical protein